MAISADLGTRLEEIVNQLVSTVATIQRAKCCAKAFALSKSGRSALPPSTQPSPQVSRCRCRRVKPADEVLDRLEAKYTAMAEKSK